MRITQSMLSSNSLKYISDSYSKLDTLQTQLNTGKKITKPSEDPVVAIKGIRYRTDLVKIEQYERNVSEAHGWIDSTDDALNQANSALQRMRELIVGAANGTNTPDELQAVGAEMKQLLEHVGTIGNTMYGEKYLFGGTATDVKPFNETSPISRNNTSNMELVTIEVGDGVHLQVNANMTKVFTQEQFNTIQAMVTELDTSDSFSDENIAKLDNILNEFSTARTQIGALSNRLDMINDRVATQKVIAQKIISDNEDAETEEIITQLKTQEAMHTAALAVSARVLQPTLLDFLR